MDKFLLESYDYFLPENLIAKYPLKNKEKAKLLVYKQKEQEIIHTHFNDLFNFIPKDYLFVLNNTKVIKARIYGKKITGGQIEILFHKAINSGFLVQIKGKVRIGDKILLEKDFSAKVLTLLENGFRIVKFYHKNTCLSEIFTMLDCIGHTPLPPYIKRNDEINDINAYQSVFAKECGAIAAPTASLHFSHKMKSYLLKNYATAFLTLHVGAGTFMGVECSDIREHQIHKEYLQITQENLKKIKNSKNILCIGTTSMRSVEFLHQQKQGDFFGDCDIFIHCGNPPQKTNALLTNFHLPKSSLIMLVASIIGLEQCHKIYQEAINKKYRFYSYGDGMLII